MSGLHAALGADLSTALKSRAVDAAASPSGGPPSRVGGACAHRNGALMHRTIVGRNYDFLGIVVRIGRICRVNGSETGQRKHVTRRTRIYSAKIRFQRRLGKTDFKCCLGGPGQLASPPPIPPPLAVPLPHRL